MHRQAAFCGRVGVGRRHRVLGEPGEDVADAALACLISPAPGDDAAVNHAAHARHLGQFRAVHHVAGGGAHDRDHLAGLGSGGGRRGDVRVDVAGRHRDAFRQAGPFRRVAGQRAGQGSERQHRMLQLVRGEAGEPRIKRGEELAGRVAAVLPDALVPRRARVPRLSPGQLPDDPVGCLDPPVGAGVDTGILVQQLERLGELPFRRDLAAVPGYPRFAAVMRQRVDPVRLLLGGVMLPELGIGVRAAGQLGQPAQRHPAAQYRHDRARGEVGADADDQVRVDPGLADGGRDGAPQHVAVVLRVLQRPVRRQLLAGGGERFVHDGVAVLVHRGAEFRAVAHPDHKRPSGQRPVVHADNTRIPAGRGADSVVSANSHGPDPARCFPPAQPGLAHQRRSRPAPGRA